MRTFFWDNLIPIYINMYYNICIYKYIKQATNQIKPNTGTKKKNEKEEREKIIQAILKMARFVL